MTSIEQLQLCGIRSFDPNPVNKQSVEFHKPLTVILGKNGSGKTTIIEALLNACTGSMPPGSGTEKSSFVYDPKVIGESEVKAQIRLLFTGRGGKAMQVIRSFQVTRHRQKTSFSTLDNTVAYQDAASGKVVSSTYRASDVDRVIPEMLGVSPAVLEHVLFCHQEDCNWPLDPPKNVKRIFDDIFAATRYVLALDRLRENSKEFRRQQKEHEASLMALREHRDQAKQLESDIEKKEGLVVLIQNRSKSLEPDMQELRKASSALDAVEQNIEGYSREAAVLQGRIGEKRDAIARMGFSAPKESVDELRALQQEAADRSQGSCEVLQQCQEELRVKEDSSRSTEEKLFQLRSQVQVLERDQQQHQGVVAELSELLRELSNEGITYDAVSMDEGALAEIQQRAHASLTAVRTHRDAARAASGREVEDVDARRQALLRTLEAETREVDMLHGLIRGLAPQRLEAEKSMKDLGGVQATEQLEACRSRVHQLEARVEAAMKLREKGERHQRRERVLEELKAENVRVARLRQQLSKEKQRSGREEELTSMRHQLCQREDRLAEALAQHVVPQLGPLLIEVSDATSLNDIVAATQHERRVRSDRLLHIQHTLSNLERQEAALQQRKECLLEEYTLKEDELGRKHGACKAALGDMDLEHYDRHLREAKDNYERHRQQHQSWTFMHSCRSDYAETAKRDNKCQVCERPFATEQEALRFIEAQKQPPTASVPTSEDICESARETLAKLERVQQTVDEVRQLQQWIPGVKQTIQQLNAQLEQTRAELADEVQKLEAAKSRLSRVEEVAQRLSGMSMMESEVDGLRMQLKRREQQLNDLEREVRVEDGEGQGPRRSFDDLSDEYEEAFRNVDQLNLQLSELQRMEKDEGTDTLDRELQSCRGELHQAELAAAKAGDVQATLSRLCREEEQHRSRLQDIGARQSTLQAELKRLEAQLQTIQEATKETDLAEARLVEATENTYRRFEMAASKLRSYWTSLTTHQLQTARMNLAESEALRDRNATEVGALREKVRTIQASMEDHRHRMSEIDRSLLRREQEDLLQEDEQRLAQVEHSLLELKGSEVPAMRRLLGEQAHEQPLPRLRELIRGKLSELEKLRAQQEGHVEASMQEINNLKAQMGKEKYHNIEKRYRSTFLKVQTTEIAVKDIEKYYNALEKAVQSYHQEKIAQINLIISDLWRQTYRGSDIDTVEIRSETDTTTTTAARRSYNYRVIMKRGTTEVDMRGRCSAGQKVLASVIIRLALSEAFCCECGILALDEPTTNLDEDNARSLAEALRVLIETRRTIKHFQLIVITHDEQFVRALGGQSVESFYYVHKDRDGAFSLIEKRTFHQLFT